ncbi:hypothetical protein GF362_03130 [Candidatus Dojkabacteria bacterium]|nr:hypothetical protein [Candidatus Dojkabacteria bacterium]
MKRKFLLTITIPLILLSLFHNASYAETNCNTRFDDIPHQNSICLHVNYLDYLNVIDDSKSSFEPNKFITRGELIRQIVEVFSLKADISGYENLPSFSDVKKRNPYFDPIYTAKELNILGYRNKNSFRPNDYISRAEAIKYVVKAGRIDNYDLFYQRGELDYIDLPYTNPFYSYVQSAYLSTKGLPTEEQILTLTKAKKFRPASNLTNYEATKILTNSHKLIQKTKYPKSGTQIPPTYTIYDSGYIIYYYEHLGLTIISTHKEFDFLYHPYMAAKVEEYARFNNFTYVVNGSFYGGSWKSCSHAGFLNYYGTHYSHFKPPEASNQLTHIVRFIKSENRMEFIDRNDFETNNTDINTLEFQTGPIVMIDRKIQYQYVNPSKNGTKSALRTMLGTTDGYEKFFIITRKPAKIHEVGDFLLSLELFEGKSLDVINLDGGSSTTLYSKNHPEINFYPYKRLPILVGLR